MFYANENNLKRIVSEYSKLDFEFFPRLNTIYYVNIQKLIK